MKCYNLAEMLEAGGMMRNPHLENKPDRNNVSHHPFSRKGLGIIFKSQGKKGLHFISKVIG